MLINILSYNIFTSVAEPIRFNGQTRRIYQLGAAIETIGPLDVIAIQESNVKSQHLLVIEQLKKLGFYYKTEPISGSIFQGKLVTGGIVVFSKWPIEYVKKEIFNDCIDDDCLSAKGFVHCVINKEGYRFQIIATHLQAFDLHHLIRNKQIEQLKKYLKSIDHKRLILIGDLNIDFYKNYKDLKNLESDDFQFVEPDLKKQKYSSDPTTNSLVGNDDPSKYISKEYPKGCYENYIKTLKCECCPQELLDHCFISKNDFLTAKALIVKLKTKTPFKIKFNLTDEEKEINDISDHYPLLVSLETKEEEFLKQDLIHLEQKKEVSFGIFYLILFGVFVIILALLLVVLFSW